MIIKSEAELIKLGEEFGRKLKGGEVIELVGDVGVGKTTFTKGIAKALSITDEINSPSFTIMKEYKGKIGDKVVYLKHYDFYRLNDIGDMKNELADEVGNSDVITMIEWAKDISGILPDERLEVEIKYLPDNNGREILLQARGLQEMGRK
jgi:tRNA threonylcarbamoyladenosine biosynthesis protein TsaE